MHEVIRPDVSQTNTAQDLDARERKQPDLIKKRWGVRIQ